MELPEQHFRREIAAACAGNEGLVLVRLPAGSSAIVSTYGTMSDLIFAVELILKRTAETAEKAVRLHPCAQCERNARRVGKARAGRLLDGVVHDAMPGDAARRAGEGKRDS